MKKVIISGIIMLAGAALTAGLFGCDEKKDENSQLLPLAALMTASQMIPECGSKWTVVTPADGTDHISTTTNIVIRRNADLDTTPDTNDQVTLHTNTTSGTPVEFDMNNSELNISDDTVTINPTDSLHNATTYSAIIITSFEAAGAADLASEKCRISDYDFRTENK